MQLNYSLLDLPRVFWRIAGFCDISSLCVLGQTCSKARVLVTHDNVWREVLTRLNLGSDLPSLVLDDATLGEISLYQFFLGYVIAPRALAGQFSFTSEPFDGDGAYPIREASLHVTIARLGLPEPRRCGRVRMSIRYSTGMPEYMDGTLGYSTKKQAFVISTCVSGDWNGTGNTRGPTFLAVLARGTRRWANQSKQQFQEHQGGLRLVMTPVMPQNLKTRSQLTSGDIISVSRALPPGRVPALLSPMRPQTHNAPAMGRRQQPDRSEMIRSR